MAPIRKRIKTLCGLDGYKKIDPPEMYVLRNNVWYNFCQVEVTKVHTSIDIHSLYKRLPADYEVVDISSYEKPF